MYSYDYLEKAHHSSYSKLKQIKESTICGCFCCTKIFQVSDFPDDWLQDKQTSRETTLQCPHCFLNSFLGDASGFPVADPVFIAAKNQI